MMIRSYAARPAANRSIVSAIISWKLASAPRISSSPKAKASLTDLWPLAWARKQLLSKRITAENKTGKKISISPYKGDLARRADVPKDGGRCHT